MMISRLLASLALALFFVLPLTAHKDGSKLVHGMDGTCYLEVSGSPFIILGGELGNSSASSVADIDSIFPRLKDAGLNTILVPAYWELIEPQEGKFDFSLINHAIDRAAGLDMHLVFLWFGAWKNSMSCYAPLWFKSDFERFPRARNAAGRPLEIASAFSPAVLNADSYAFAALMRHIAEYDSRGTVIMMQIENEIGMLESARDHSPAADSAFRASVPQQLIDWMTANESSLHPSLLERWKKNGSRRSGTWSEVFGSGIETDEIFMAWYYAAYVEQLARIAREISPDMPLYVNAAMNSRGRRPGEYPSAGPLAHLKDVWHAAAPSVDILAPDLYDKGFVDWTAQYALPDNPLFIPEIRLSPDNGAQALFAIGERDAVGFSPFSIENISSPRLGMAYGLISQLTPLIASTRANNPADICGVWFDADSTETVIFPASEPDLRLTARHFFTLPWDPRATDGSRWPEAGGIIIRIAPDEFIVAGTGIVISFDLEGDTSVTAPLGEDGFLAAGSDRSESAPARWTGSGRVGIGHVAEVTISPDGTVSPLRHFNGDETHQGRHVRIGVDDFKILHVKLYRYR